jgi:glycosyltransferase involved in cell wall biosynthesis
MSDCATPRISVVTPCLNDANHIRAMLDSYVTQDYPNKELFVQDGGSTDGTLEILAKYAVRWVSEPDSGPHDAINRGLATTTGNIIVIMPANDVFTPGSFSLAARVLTANPTAMLVYGDSELIDEDGVAYDDWPAGPLDIDDLFWHQQFLLQSTYIRREVFNIIGCFDGRIVGPGDTEWIFRFVERYPASAMVYVRETLSGHRRRRRFDSVSYHNCSEGARTVLAIGERFLRHSENRARLRYGVDRARAGTLCRAAVLWSCAGQFRMAWRTYVSALSAHPRILLTMSGIKVCLHLLFGPKGSSWCRSCLAVLHRSLKRISTPRANRSSLTGSARPCSRAANLRM